MYIVKSLLTCHSEIIYPRNVPVDARTDVPRPKDFPDYTFSSTEELTLPTPDGESLSAFLLKPTNMLYAKHAPITIIMFHGNAGNIGHRLPIAGVLDQFVDANILMVEYRGYGLSTGRPDEKGLNIDGQTALDYVRERKDLNGSKIVVYGQSLGGAVSIQLAARNLEQGDIAALILENTFTSIRKLIPTYGYPVPCLILIQRTTAQEQQREHADDVVTVRFHQQDLSRIYVIRFGQVRRHYPISPIYRFYFSAG